jgi:organic radical activating enzyme
MVTKLSDIYPTPRYVVWDITYACPLRCTHCYSESGRRPSRHLDAAGLLQVADAMIAARPAAIVFSGGEPLVVRELFTVAERMVAAGLEVLLYTSGWSLVPSMLPAITGLFSRVIVSVDGATADVHDRIRGQRGSFSRAMDALRQLDLAVAELRATGSWSPQLAIDYVVTRSNFDQLAPFCAHVLPQFDQLFSVSFGAVIPTGLASRPSFAEAELLTDEQAELLAGPRLVDELRAIAPDSVLVNTSDNRRFQLHPELLAAGIDIPPIQVEPDGKVRAMPIYEGTVGSLLEEPLSQLWARAIDRWSDPFVVEALTPAKTMTAWAAATRRIDERFGTELDRARIARRPPYSHLHT